MRKLPAIKIAAFFVLSLATCLAQIPSVTTAAPHASEDQRRQLFKGFDLGSSFDEKAAKQPEGEITIWFGHSVDRIDTPGGAVKDSATYIRSLAKRVDTIVIAEAESVSSSLTPQRKFIYSNWNFRVISTYKTKTSMEAKPNSEIIVSRPGGTVHENGRTYTAVDTGFRDFVKSHKYLLFLKQISGTSDYRIEFDSCFDVTTGQLQPLEPTPDRSGAAGDRLNEIIPILESISAVRR